MPSEIVFWCLSIPTKILTRKTVFSGGWKREWKWETGCNNTIQASSSDFKSILYPNRCSHRYICGIVFCHSTYVWRSVTLCISRNESRRSSKQFYSETIFEIYGYRSHVSMCTYEGVGATCTSTPSSTLNRWTTFRFLYLVMPKFRCLRPLKVQHTRSSRKSQAARMYVLVLYIQVQIGDAFWSTSGEKEKKKKKKKQKKPSWRISTSYSFRQFDTEYALSSIIFIN